MGDEFFNRVNLDPGAVDMVVRHAAVARRCVKGNRHPKLFHTHHREVSSLSGAQQREVLSRAADEALSSMDVRKIVREIRDGNERKTKATGPV